ncbi:site-specific integrase [Chitinophaga barathri]|uniref:Site-specific integrase n=1 Tax=Chitinophaga barathri TaxID=1647451 RepID=A0A3N4MEW3_9BACT|nr:site-specific integrase [Chitinophaga barathri]RPD40526.1 site-specific integrase [Chitinophaga barathri]
MPTVNFNLRKQESKEPQIIYLIFRWPGHKFKYPLQLKVLPKYWDGERQCVKNIIAAPNKDAINRHLADIKKEVNAIYTNAVADRTPVTKQHLKTELDTFTNRTTPDKTLLGFIRHYIDTAGERINPVSGKITSIRTIQKYNTTYDVLKEFADGYNRRLDFDTVDLDFYQDFVGYLTTIKNYKVNTVGKYVATLKGFLNAAGEKKLTTRTDHKSKRFKVMSEDSAAIYSPVTELLKVYDLDLSENKRLEKVRDLFIVGAFTGLRFSDFTALKSSNIIGENIEVYQQKTGGKVVIPIHWTVKEILGKYENSLPTNISNQKMNDYIKDVYKEAEITEQIEIQNTKGGLRKVESFEKWELVSTHTARRSFATNLYLQGIPSQTIMKITGHKTEKAFLKYIRLDGKEHANLLREMWDTKQPLRAVK